MVDGGKSYLRRTTHKNHPYTEMSKYFTDDHTHNRKYFNWGSRGVDGKQPLEYILLKDMDTSHIEAILDTQLVYIKNTYIEDLFFDEINFRITESK